MKNIILLNTFFIIHFLSFSQIVGFEKKDTTKSFIIFENTLNKKVLFGFNHAFIYLGYKDPVTFKRTRAMVNSFEPHVSIYPKIIKNLGFGVNGKIEYFSSNFATNNTPNVYEFGMFVRYFIPFNINVKVFNRLSFSTGFSFSKTNYSRRDDDIYYFGTDSSYTMYPNMSQTLLRFYLTYQFRVYRGLNIKISYRYEMYLKKYYKFIPAFGLEYHFYYEEKKRKKRDL